MKLYTVTTRGSELALTVTALIVARLRMAFKELVANEDERPEFVITTTRAIGDKHRGEWSTFKESFDSDARSRKWTKELEELVSVGERDVAIHAGKDLPFKVFENTAYYPVLQREDERDVLISRDGIANLSSLPSGASVGTNSFRRRANLRALRPDLRFTDYGGNVTTRINPKIMAERNVDAIIMAAAGLKRLRMFNDKTMQPLSLFESLPAGNQGILALQLSASPDELLKRAVRSLIDPATFIAWHAERSFLEEFSATCETPISVHASVLTEMEKPRQIVLRARVPTGGGEYQMMFELIGKVDDETDYEATARALGKDLATKARDAGARQLVGSQNVSTIVS